MDRPARTRQPSTRVSRGVGISAREQPGCEALVGDVLGVIRSFLESVR